jgi:hypothetical protein
VIESIEVDNRMIIIRECGRRFEDLFSSGYKVTVIHDKFQ